MDKIERAMEILEQLLRCWSNCEDIDELKSIGYFVIGRLMLKTDVKNWDGLVRVSLRNAFRTYYCKKKRENCFKYKMLSFRQGDKR